MALYPQRTQLLLQIAGLTLLVVGSIAGFSNWLSQAKADPPSEKKIIDVRDMSAKERADLGEKLIFGAVGASKIEGSVGKAQCPLCHGFFKESKIVDPNIYPSPPWGPHFINFTQRIERLVASPKYQQRPKDTEQPEAFPGSGIAINVIEYLAESNICPSCYVIPGFGRRDTHDRESLMPKIHKPPISLSIDELIAVDTWLYVHDGKEPPSPDEIEKAYRKFIPATEWPMPIREPGIYPSTYSPTPSPSPPAKVATGAESITTLFTMGMCIYCHVIPGIRGPEVPVILGPKLVMKTTAPKRLKDRKYKGKATNVREYVIESILDPNAYVVKGYGVNMPKDYRTRFSNAAIEKMAEYLEQLEEGKKPPMIMK